MLDFIHLLGHCYARVLRNTPEESALRAGYQEQLTGIRLAEAFLRKGQWIQHQPDHPLQIAVIGPTQAGKSTLVNLLLGTPLAGVSPLAGYTVHPQGFSINLQTPQAAGLETFFADFQCLPQDQLSPDRHPCYSVTEAIHDRNHPLPACLLWDTPDFDSIGAQGYSESVLRTAALADVVLLVVSKDKYADQAVWDMLALLEPLQQPTVVCINKVAEPSRSVLLNSLRQQWQERRRDQPVALVALGYQEGGQPHWSEAAATPLIAALKTASGQHRRKKWQQRGVRFINQHWPNWTAPLINEHKALECWEGHVHQAIQEALQLYRRDFLDHPQHYETLQRALVELLELLEIPGLAKPLAYTRRIITWPIHQLGKALRSRRIDPDEETLAGQEAGIIQQLLEHIIIRLAEAILEETEARPEQARWWRELGAHLRAEQAGLSQGFRAALQRYHQEFQPEIEASAERLYHKLEEQPAVLNSLRATRATADAAAVALALKTGGIGLQDLILTPAMLSLTSLLAESTLGGYMRKVAAELKQRQYQAVEQQLFTGIVERDLLKLPAQLETDDKFNIPRETLQAANEWLKKPRYGLHIL